jgi:rubrerythrin
LSLFGCTETQPPIAKVEPSPVKPAATKAESKADSSPTTAEAESPTVKNLQAAYNGESNANVTYLAFAAKADQEGYKQVGTLFRAAAKAEQIHRDNHAQVIQSLGATPKNTITAPNVKSTTENLDHAIKGESYERDKMYPNFITQAETEKKQAAVQTLKYALTAEAQHAKLYTEAKNNLDGWREQTYLFYVCNISGETFTNEKDTASCPNASSGKAYGSVN